MRNYKNDRGEGKIFNFDLIDREGTLIQATFFNENAERWFPKLQENHVYIIANGQVKMSNKKFTSIKNDFCLTLGNETEIQECAEDTGITSNGFTFTRIEQIKQTPASATVDIIGAVIEISPLSSIKMKNGDSRDKLGLTVGDDSGFSVSVTVWGDLCQHL